VSRGRVEISAEVADILTQSTTDGTVLTLPPGQLDRPLYQAVDKVLKALGGKWDRHAGGHRFANPVTDVLAEALGTGHVVDQKKALEQFFTPPAVATRMVAALEFTREARVLEPSAGGGALIEAIAKASPTAIIHAVELDPRLCAALRAKWGLRARIDEGDFMSFQAQGSYDFVIMNPPFSRGQDMAHVQRAFELLQPGGQLLAIMSPHWTFAENNAAREFRAFVGGQSHGWDALPEGAFTESGTGVSTGILTLRKAIELPTTTRRPALNAPATPGAATISLANITHGANPRRYFDQQKHIELVGSIRLRGVLQPLLLRPSPDAEGVFMIVAGERRYRAALEVFGPDGAVPVVIRDMTDQEALEAAIDENDIRDDASETEQADAAVRVLAACQSDRAEAAKRLGWSPAKLDRRLALAGLSAAAKLALDERRIKVGHAELLAAVPPDKQDKALETIVGSSLDVATTRALLMRVTRSLAGALFDKTECTSCPFNSGTQRVLFETHVEDGHCTNPGCFQLKTEAADAARAAEKEREAAATALPATAATPLVGTCRVCGCTEDRACEEACSWADETKTLCDNPDCLAKVKEPEPLGEPVRESTPAPAPSPTPAPTSPAAQKVTAKSLATRATDVRQAAWRSAVAKALAGDAANARTTILVAAMSGTLSQIKPTTLTARAGALIGPSFTALSFSAKITEVHGLESERADDALSAIAAAYARDALNFEQVADLARAFDVDLRGSWQIDKAFLDRWGKDELKFIAQECGLVAHMGPKPFAKLLTAKKADLIAGMLNVVGFDWAARLPSCMTLDGKCSPPPAMRALPDEGAAAEAPLADASA
jgi:ParB family chromosome partitioning protein